MAGIPSYDYFLEQLINLYTTKKFSDVLLEIFEEDGTERHMYSRINVHSMILNMSSSYFEKYFADQGEMPHNLVVNVKHGQGKYMDNIIASFYDKDVLNNLDVADLLCILELAKIYTNDEFIKNVLQHLEGNVEVDFDTCNTVLTKIITLEQDDSLINQDNTTKVKNSYISHMVKLLSPIEERNSEHRKYLDLSHASFVTLLKGDNILSISENSLLTFIILWLEYDLTRQTGTIIEELLQSLRVKYLSFDFLFTTITFDHIVLNKWNGYHKWLNDCLGLLGMSSPLRKSKYPDYDQQTSRISGIHAWYQNKVNTCSNAVRWLVHMTPEKPGEMFGPTEHLLIHDGYKFSPTQINIASTPAIAPNFSLSLSISYTGFLSAVHFVVGIVPADREYNISNIHFGYPFAQSFLKLSPSLTFNSDSQVLDLWTCSQDFLDVANEHGIYVMLLPITDSEWQQISTMKFKMDNRNFLQIHHYYSTSRSAKIHLTKEANYSI